MTSDTTKARNYEIRNSQSHDTTFMPTDVLLINAFLSAVQEDER
jgi:hypothetical protein